LYGNVGMTWMNNMRAIKFRMWSKLSKKFFHDEQVALDCLNQSKNPSLSAKFADMVWQQNTGVLDKNNEEVFEGDIIKFIWDANNKEKTGEIKFKAGSFYAEIVFPSGALNVMWLHELDNRGLIKNNFEVIGNVFQNNL